MEDLNLCMIGEGFGKEDSEMISIVLNVDMMNSISGDTTINS